MASKWWVVTAALLVSLSGCASDAPGTDPAVEDTHDLDAGNETVEAPSVNNTAPVAVLVASALNGTAPLNVTLTLEGSDAEGDNLTWELTIGNMTETGDALPATLNKTLEAGNHTIILTVSDGELTGNSTLVIVVADGVPSGPCGGEPEPCIVGEDAYAIFWSDGRCDAHPDQVYGTAGFYVHERAAIPGTAFVAGGGTWLYEEGNDIPGMQIDGAFEGGTYADCVGGDIGIF